jgi:hypothetical protein
MCTYYLYIGDMVVVVCKKEIIIKKQSELWVIFGVFLFSWKKKKKKNVGDSIEREGRTNDSSALPSPIWPLAVKPSLGYRTVTLLFKKDVVLLYSPRSR